MDRTLRGKRSGENPTGQSDELDALLRSIAHAPARSPPRDPPEGANWGAGGRYVIERRLGRGGMGTVYVASDTLLGRLVALKVLDTGEADGADSAYHARLLREARLAAQLEHERVARVYDVGEHEGSPFVAMEYVRGVTLRGWMSECQREPAEILVIATQIAEGLSVLHASGVIHRDLKPENVMLAAQGGTKLVDFGLARQVARVQEEPSLDLEGRGIDAGTFTACLGTPGYMAPEHCRGQPVDVRADVFALGVILYELVTGQRPFRGSTLPAIMRATLEEAPVLTGPAWDRFPAGLRDVTRRMLERDTEARYANGSEALQALRELQPPSSSVPAGGAALSISPDRTPARWGRWLAPAVGLVLLGGAVVIAVPRIVRERALRRALAAPPRPGMALVDARMMAIGRNREEVDRQCSELGPNCDRERLDSQLPARTLVVAPFYMDVHEVTNAEMAEVLNALVASLYVVPDEDDHSPRYVRFNQGLGHDGELLLDMHPLRGAIEFAPQNAYPKRRFGVKAGREDLPVTQVSWFGARLFCATKGKRLPTEIEWEAAARGKENRDFPWGGAAVQCGGVAVAPDGLIPMESGCPALALPWRVGEAQQDVTPEGIHDLGGNVTEWVDAVFDVGATDATLGPLEIPRVVRGGSYYRSLMARTSTRLRQLPNNIAPNGGFRCAASVHAE
jgi:formylglycine-generating enzyme required for sulfatase activity/predicted Ser/Thr protein kinase